MLALPLERFFVLTDIIRQRREAEAKDDLIGASFTAWQVIEHQYRAMYMQAKSSAWSKEHAQAIQNDEKKFWADFPNFPDYLKQLGIGEDE